jgi:hypothetical protein
MAFSGYSLNLDSDGAVSAYLSLSFFSLKFLKGVLLLAGFNYRVS